LSTVAGAEAAIGRHGSAGVFRPVVVALHDIGATINNLTIFYEICILVRVIVELFLNSHDLRQFFPQDYGFYSLAKNKLLYVSRATETWGPPVRVFAPPEITVIDLT
jgi:hypothetical protein